MFDNNVGGDVISHSYHETITWILCVVKIETNSWYININIKLKMVRGFYWFMWASWYTYKILSAITREDKMGKYGKVNDFRVKRLKSCANTNCWETIGLSNIFISNISLYHFHHFIVYFSFVFKTYITHVSVSLCRFQK